MTVHILTFDRKGSQLSIAEGSDFPNAQHLTGSVRAVFDSVRMNVGPDDVIAMEVRHKGHSHTRTINGSTLRRTARTLH